MDRSGPGGAAGAGAVADGVSTVLAGFMAEVHPQAEAHGVVYERLWKELGRAVSGGKRFRGRLVVEMHDALAGSRQAVAAQVGAAFELLHAGFLIHDDLIDQDTMRRGEPNLAARMAALAGEAGAAEGEAQRLSEASAVLAGDLAMALAHRLVATVAVPPPVHLQLQQLLWETVFVSVAGELGDVVAALGLRDVSLDDASRIAAEKTARYSFQAPLLAGAILADASTQLREEVEVIGLALGTAFQLVDDLLGVFAPESVTGKSALSDLREGKVTTLVLQARRLPVWSRIGQAIGRPGLDEATAAVLRRELAGSAAPGRVVEEARRELVVAERMVDGSAALAPAAPVIRKVSTMIERGLTDAVGHVSAAAA